MSRSGFKDQGLDKALTFIAKQSMHISNVNQIFFMLTGHTDRHFPFMNEFKDLLHGWRWKDRRFFRKPTNEFVEELFGRDLKVKRITTVLDKDIEELEKRLRIKDWLSPRGSGGLGFVRD